KSAAVTAGKKALTATINELTAAAEKLAPDKCESAATILDLFDEACPHMVADAKRDADNPDPCAIAPDSQYRGREHQLYRVEIHQPGLAGTAGAAPPLEARGHAVGRVPVASHGADADVGEETARDESENQGGNDRAG